MRKIFSLQDLPASPGIDFPNPSLTEQNHEQACDINNILKRYRSGLPLVDPTTVDGTRVPQYGDFSNITDFRTAQQAVVDANTKFQSLPARLREEFDNDPAKFLEAYDNPDKQEVLKKYGIVNPVFVDNTGVDIRNDSIPDISVDKGSSEVSE